MAKSGDNLRSSSSSSSSGEVSVNFEREIGAASGSEVKEVNSRHTSPAAGPANNGNANSSENSGRSISKVNTLPVEVSSSDKLEPTSSQLKLERAKTESHRLRNILAEEAAQIYDNKISVEQKIKLLNRIATVKDDGTVEFEVPGDVEPQDLGAGSEGVYNEVQDEPLDATDLQYIPPLQIVMLIVGTRGDVQPFIAIGKRLQVHPGVFNVSSTQQGIDIPGPGQGFFHP
ncbi:hypothetical protein Q3G72_024758 [Acer saccharum]|nr:hypothetical protein Q3G72_024758 [Acer saccharum]